MNTTQLECFMAVANFLNFSRAAEQLRLTQPAVSHQINTLEDELGSKLFHRTSKSVRLTQAGQLFTQYAGEILRLSGLSKTRLREYEKNQPMRLGIGCRSFLELQLLRPVLSKFRQEEPQLLPILRLIPFHSLENLLDERDIQLMFVFQGSAPKKAVYRQMALCTIACACSQDYPLSQESQLTLQQLKGFGRITACPQHCYPSSLLEVQNQLVTGRTPDQLLFCDNLETACTLAEAGFAFMLVPDLPQTRLPGLRYIPLADLPPISYGVAYLAEEFTPSLRRFLSVLEEELRQEASE